MRTLVTFCLTLGLALPVQATLTHSEVVKIVTTDGGTNLWIETDDNDSVITFHDPGNHWFSMGIDKSDAGTFKIREGGDLNSSRGISIETNGQVGIGTSNPVSLFAVSAGTAGDAVLTLEADTDNNNENDNPRLEFLQDGSAVAAIVGFREEGVTTNLFRISAYGSASPEYDAITISPWTQFVSIGERLGIGTDNPSGKLDVADSFFTQTGAVVVRPQNTTNEGGQLILAGSASNPDWNLDSYSDRFRVFNSTERFSITGSGNVGIGNSSPAYRLDVNGSLHAASLVVEGNVGIGISTPGNKLEVNGVIRSKEVIVESTGWPDDVFTGDYDLPSLDEVERHIAAFGHLPGVPSESEVAGGVKIGDMQQVLLRKVEELTLHLIRQEKEIQQLRIALGQTSEDR